MITVDPLQILEKLEIPPASRFVSVQPGEAKFMHEWVKQNRLTRTLEIGFAYGASAASIMSAHEGQHTCMDPFQTAEFSDLGLRNIASLGYAGRLDFHPGFSHDVLPRLLAEKRTYDFAFIDGDHRYDGISLDFYYVDRLLAEGGYVVFHDAWMRSTQMVASFIRRNRRDYKQIRSPERNLTMFKKIGHDDRVWHHFREFYTAKGFLTQRAVLWMMNRGILNRFLGHID